MGVIETAKTINKKQSLLDSLKNSDPILHKKRIAELETAIKLDQNEWTALNEKSEELKNKRCRQSKIDEKQRGLIRSFLRKNPWIEEDFYNFRDSVLGE